MCQLNKRARNLHKKKDKVQCMIQGNNNSTQSSNPATTQVFQLQYTTCKTELRMETSNQQNKLISIVTHALYHVCSKIISVQLWMWKSHRSISIQCKWNYMQTKNKTDVEHKLNWCWTDVGWPVQLFRLYFVYTAFSRGHISSCYSKLQASKYEPANYKWVNYKPTNFQTSKVQTVFITMHSSSRRIAIVGDQ